MCTPLAWVATGTWKRPGGKIATDEISCQTLSISGFNSGSSEGLRRVLGTVCIYLSFQGHLPLVCKSSLALPSSRHPLHWLGVMVLTLSSPTPFFFPHSLSKFFWIIFDWQKIYLKKYQVLRYSPFIFLFLLNHRTMIQTKTLAYLNTTLLTRPWSMSPINKIIHVLVIHGHTKDLLCIYYMVSIIPSTVNKSTNKEAKMTSVFSWNLHSTGKGQLNSFWRRQQCKTKWERGQL